jgi:hypothetical protein
MKTEKEVPVKIYLRGSSLWHTQDRERAMTST